jgi:hypothetical protein
LKEKGAGDDHTIMLPQKKKGNIKRNVVGLAATSSSCSFKKSVCGVLYPPLPPIISASRGGGEELKLLGRNHQKKAEDAMHFQQDDCSGTQENPIEC